MKTAPSTNGSNGNRESNGRFAKGNPGGPGNPHARKVARLRSLILESVTEDDLRAIVAVLVKRAREGDLAAIRELFNRLIGSPADVVDRKEQAKQRHKIALEQLELADRRVELQEDRLFHR